MNSIERLRQYLSKASFSSSSDKFSALECLSEIEQEKEATARRVAAIQDEAELKRLHEKNLEKVVGKFHTYGMYQYELEMALVRHADEIVAALQPYLKKGETK
jgi:hypothetical protein